MADIKIYGELVNETPDGYVTSAGQIKDLVLNKTQDEINQDVASKADTVTGVDYDSTQCELTETINGVASTIVTAEKIVADGGAVLAEEKGSANGVATLDSGGRVPSSQLPSYVDDVIEAYPRAGQTELSANWLATQSASGPVIVPESGKIYVLMANTTHYDAESQFRWGGSAYVKLNDGGVSAITKEEIDDICR